MQVMIHNSETGRVHEVLELFLGDNVHKSLSLYLPILCEDYAAVGNALSMRFFINFPNRNASIALDHLQFLKVSTGNYL